ncbi:MAG TPA: hypothetical protein VKY26_00270 [Actinomycetota bacterium]|nr:hypothetical protein [Actinomycetota bacterium]
MPHDVTAPYRGDRRRRVRSEEQLEPVSAGDSVVIDERNDRTGGGARSCLEGGDHTLLADDYLLGLAKGTHHASCGLVFASTNDHDLIHCPSLIDQSGQTLFQLRRTAVGRDDD